MIKKMLNTWSLPSILVLFAFPALFVAKVGMAATYSENYGQACTAGEIAENKCFVTPVSRYSFRIIEAEGESCGTSLKTINGFPTNVYNGTTYEGKLWCYEIVHPSTATRSSLNQVALSLPLNVYRQPVTGTIFTNLVSSGDSDQKAFKYSVFTFDAIKGCLGDPSTNFEVGDIRGCGMKWTANIPASAPYRFWYMTSPEAEPGVDITEMVPKIGSGIEPGFILGASGASPYAPTSSNTCQEIDGNFFKFTNDSANCPVEVSSCDEQCKVCTLLQAGNKDLVAVLKDKEGNPLPGFGDLHRTIKEIGFLLGGKYCAAGHIVTGENSCTSLFLNGKFYKSCY